MTKKRPNDKKYAVAARLAPVVPGVHPQSAAATTPRQCLAASAAARTYSDQYERHKIGQNTVAKRWISGVLPLMFRVVSQADECNPKVSAPIEYS